VAAAALDRALIEGVHAQGARHLAVSGLTASA
jgi:hypothetical protein